MQRIRVPDEVAALIRGLHPVLKRKVHAALEDVRSDPSAGKSLQEELSGLRSYRVGRFRLIYRVAARGTIEVVAIGPRSVIYEETLRLLRRDS